MFLIFLICISQNTVSYVDDNKLFIANGIGELENETIIDIIWLWKDLLESIWVSIFL